MPFIKLNHADNLKIFYILHRCQNPDEANTIILIHGAGGNHLSMLSVFDYIKKMHGNSFNILAFDLPFHFRSSTADNISSISFEDKNSNLPSSESGIKYYSIILNELLLKLFKNQNNFILIGHSMGAQICLKFSSLYPFKTKKIMLIAGCHKTDIKESFLKSLEKSFDRTIAIFLIDAYGTHNKNILKNAADDIKRSPVQAVINDFKFVKDFSNNKDDIKKVINIINRNEIFFNLLYSKNDLIIKEGYVKKLHKMINNSMLTEIKSRNHIDIIINNNVELERGIDKFLLT